MLVILFDKFRHQRIRDQLGKLRVLTRERNLNQPGVANGSYRQIPAKLFQRNRLRRGQICEVELVLQNGKLSRAYAGGRPRGFCSKKRLDLLVICKLRVSVEMQLAN